ncbi:L-ribulose-5-phosphate 3-epimerase [Clostridium chrysemydis]|uniref:L-ribulose-5-phosphate 3-epimerase n=1 Tax=Clostridium chrysemydis TaxID=2665504 RepID=UPI003F2C2287
MKDYVIGLYEKAMPNTLTWREKLECARFFKYDFLEMSIDETDEKLKRLDMTKEERKALVDLMFEVGVPIRTMCLSGHRKFPLGSEDKTTRERSLKIMEKAIDLACDLGIRIIQLAGYDVYYENGNEKTREFFLENLKKSVDLASRKGVILAFETMETNFMNTVGKAMEYVKKIDSPYLGVYPDCGNITNASKSLGEDVIFDLKKGHGKIFALHLKETVRGKFREIPFGTGHVDFNEIIKTSYEMGVRRFVTEFWYTGEGDYKEGIKFSKDFIDRKFEEALKDK